jgi:PhzF family phenazine biosynthesis protein
MRKYRVFQVDSFTREKLAGNPAGVVLDADGLSDEMMRRIARELNNSETAFLFPGGDGYDVRVRFFTPVSEVPICGHATVAAHYVRALVGHLVSMRVLQKTGAGILPVDIIREDGDYRIAMTQGKIEIGTPLSAALVARIADALGVPLEGLNDSCPVAAASTGYGKLMVGIRDVAALHRLSPDMAALSRISGEIGCNGYCVFTLHPGADALVHARVFAPFSGIPEDPVTGNANGPLGAYLVHYGVVKPGDGAFSFAAIQGEAMKRPGRMTVEVDVKGGAPVKVRIVGEAVVAFSTEIEIGDPSA